MNLRNLYLALAVIGAVVPYAFFISFWSVEGLGIAHFIASWFVNGSAGGAAADLLISSLVFWVYIINRRRHGGPNPLPFIAINLIIGLSCALPAYLWFISGGGSESSDAS